MKKLFDYGHKYSYIIKNIQAFQCHNDTRRYNRFIELQETLKFDYALNNINKGLINLYTSKCLCNVTHCLL